MEGDPMNHKDTVTLETERLILRRFTLEDADAMFRNFFSDPEAVHFSRWEPHKTAKETEAVIAQYVAEYYNTDCYNWAIVQEKGGEPIGRIAVSHWDERVSTADMTFFIGKAWWHKGYTSEALLRVIAFLFEQVGVNRIAGRCDVANPNSGGVMLKCGMKLEGLLRQAGRNSNGYVDVYQYGLVAEDYFAEKNKQSTGFTSNATIRKATIKDVEKLINLRLDYLTDDKGRALTTAETEAISKQLRDYIPRQMGIGFFAYLAERDGEISGVVFLAVSEKPANISFITGKIGTVLNVFTYPNYRRQGIATRLLNMMLVDAKAMNLSKLELSASDLGKPVYEKLGFQPSSGGKYTGMSLQLIRLEDMVNE
jgi:ribosomal-protein-alanine N-acetyltransferase